MDLAWFKRSEGAYYCSQSSDTPPLRMAAFAAEAVAFLRQFMLHNEMQPAFYNMAQGSVRNLFTSL